MSTATGDEAALEWLYDYIVQFLKSPGWRTPIMLFIEQHCYLFIDDDENRLEYTIIHEKFMNMVDGIFESLVSELNVDLELIAKACD